jgi:two-component system chemotaxis response regulator CheB
MGGYLNLIIADENEKFINIAKAACDSIADIHLLGIARSEQMLMVKVRNTRPDLILLDITPGLGGIQILDTLKTIDPDLNIIIVCRPGSHRSDILVSALEMGAMECMEKPESMVSRQFSEFRLNLLTITGLLAARKRFSGKKPCVPASAGYRNKFFMPVKSSGRLKGKRAATGRYAGKIEIVVIASSTGGPEILSRIFSLLPAGLSVPVLLVQHIPAEMTGYFAKSLNEKSELDIFQADHGDEILPGRVYVAPGGQHMTVSKPDDRGVRRIFLNVAPPVNSVRPSADILFESVADSYGGNILAIVLTGMGEDGRRGVAAMKKKGCICITQNPETCVVYGMPRSVDQAGLSDESLDPLSITQKIVALAQSQ